jgi:hypothetical protein
MKTKFIKVAVSEKLPEEEGNYHCVFPEGQIFTIPFSKDFGFHEEFTDCSGITHYLIEIPDNESAVIKRNEELEAMLEKVLKINKYHNFDGHAVNDQITELLNKNLKP